MSSQHDADILIQTHLQVPTSRNGLYQGHDILAIPQLEARNSESEANFARGYGPALLEVGLTQQVMSTFIDGLNLAMSASPPLHVVGAAGSILGYVPYHWASLPETSIQINHNHQTNTRTITLSKSLTEHYLQYANTHVFKPRGLAARLCTTSALLLLLGPPQKSNDTMKKVGRGALTVARYMPIAGLIIRQVAKSDKNKNKNDVYAPIGQRRQALVEGRTLPFILSSNGSGPPPPSVAAKKEEERKRAMARFQEAGMSNPPENDNQSSGRSAGAKAMERAERRRRHIGGHGRQARLELPKEAEWESWATDRLLWLVLMPANKDMLIEDIIMAESPANEEQVDHNVWMGEMLFEWEDMRAEEN